MVVRASAVISRSRKFVIDRPSWAAGFSSKALVLGRNRTVTTAVESIQFGRAHDIQFARVILGKCPGSEGCEALWGTCSSSTFTDTHPISKRENHSHHRKRPGRHCGVDPHSGSRFYGHPRNIASTRTACDQHFAKAPSCLLPSISTSYVE
jgi:hypothetical protein